MLILQVVLQGDGLKLSFFGMNKANAEPVS